MASQKGNAKLTVDTVEENMDVKVEKEENVEKIVEKEKPLDKDDVIEVISLIPNVSYKDKKYGDIYRWEKAGEIVEMIENAIVNKEESFGTPEGIRMLFYGLSGTGKTELARYISEKTGKKLLLKRASDIMGKYVGDNEQNIKDAFDVLMITHSSLCKGYEGALKLILDIDDDDFGTLSFENAESLEDFLHLQDFQFQVRMNE